jgi:CDP-diacylglycerol--glycerol-3-phosphate 3-phosphatidyltransferase
MLSDWLRGHTRTLVEVLAGGLGKLGFSPNALTLLGTFFMLCIGIVLSQGHLLAGGLLMVAAAAFDALDGGLARITNRVTKFGAFLDSTTDRWAEAFVYGGLIWWFMEQGLRVELMLTYAAIIGSVMVSYTRARAEGLGVDCKVGLFTRFERIAVLGLGLLFNQMYIALILLAILSNFTAIQRIWHVNKQLRDKA